jgi:hypothetical protein
MLYRLLLLVREQVLLQPLQLAQQRVQLLQ